MPDGKTIARVMVRDLRIGDKFADGPMVLAVRQAGGCWAPVTVTTSDGRSDTYPDGRAHVRVCRSPGDTGGPGVLWQQVASLPLDTPGTWDAAVGRTAPDGEPELRACEHAHFDHVSAGECARALAARLNTEAARQ